MIGVVGRIIAEISPRQIEHESVLFAFQLVVFLRVDQVAKPFQFLLTNFIGPSGGEKVEEGLVAFALLVQS